MYGTKIIVVMSYLKVLIPLSLKYSLYYLLDKNILEVWIEDFHLWGWDFHFWGGGPTNFFQKVII